MARKRAPAPKPETSSEEEEEEVKEEEEEEEDEESEEEEEDEEEEEEDLSSRDAIKQLLEPFGKDQLIELLKEAALKDPALLSRIAGAPAPAPAPSDPALRRIFVHGLGWDATTEALTAAFSPYGDIEDCRAVTDRATGRCKGYGFVLFRTPAAARKALKEPQKKIGHRMTSCQLASLGSSSTTPADPAARRVFIGGVREHVTPDRLYAFFARFGEIEEGPLGFDPITGRLRGFAVFMYRTVEGCRRVLEEPVKYFEGCELHCQGTVQGLNQNDLAAGLMGQSLNPGAVFAGQNAGVGVPNPTAGMSPYLNRSGTTPPPYGIGLGFGGGGSAVNSISPSVTGRYGSSAALQGFGTYRSSPFSSVAAVGSQSGMGSMGTSFPSYLGR